MSDGGSLIDLYRVEYRPKKTGRWELDQNLKPQYSVNNVMQCTVTNKVGVDKEVAYRVKARNAAGFSEPSKPSDEITFTDPIIK